MNNKIILPAKLTSYRPKVDKTFNLSFNTNELTESQLLAINQLNQKTGYLLFKDAEIQTEEKEMIDSLSPELKTKSHSQRLRAVIFKLWEKEGKPGDYDSYYAKKMERIIEHFKEKLA